MRVTPYLPREKFERLLEECRERRMTQAELIDAALDAYLGPPDDRLLILRSLHRLDRGLERLQRDQQLQSEAFSMFVRLWLAHTPKIASDEKDAAQRQARDRYERFVNAVGTRFAGGARFLDDLARNGASDAELARLAEETPRDVERNAVDADGADPVDDEGEFRAARGGDE